MAFSFGMIIYLIKFKPLKESNGVEIFNEVTILLLSYLLLCFTDSVPDP